MLPWLPLLLLARLAAAQEPGPADQDNRVLPPEAELSGTDLKLVFAIFRHGDRTPDLDEATLNPLAQRQTVQFFPYGMKALTNAGKTRTYRVGVHLRQRYDGFLSRLYVPDEVRVRCTDYDRTKMSALTAMAALYPPERLQQWNPNLAWQPVPYSLQPKDTCDMLYWYNCPSYMKLKSEVYSQPEMQAKIKQNADLLDFLSNHTGAAIKTPEDVFYLDNLLQAEENVGIHPPHWAESVMPRIKNITKLEYDAQFYNDKMISLAFGVMLGEVLAAAERLVTGREALPRLYVYSGHENNVAAMMAACRVFTPHQPNYGSIFALELRRNRATGKYSFLAVYKPAEEEPARLLPVRGCGGLLCDYETFLRLVADLALTRDEHTRLCRL